jgi:formylglycine-generating enzyme required for sulfatase activity/uncharacterized caspase-like protein
MSRALYGFCVLAGLLLAATVGSAQETQGKKVAFLVGINQYQKPRFRPLQFAERDVEEMGKELKALGFDVTILSGDKATLKEIDDRVKALDRPLGAADLMLVMLAGHGIQRNVPVPGGGSKDDAFFCPYDAIDGDPGTLLSLSHVIDKILAPNVGRKLLLVDACRDDPDPGRGSRGIEGKVISLPEDTAVMFSCRKGQQSFENEELKHGLFTYCILDGLRGQAVRDGEVSWTAVVDHVNRRMASREFAKYLPTGRRQEPIPAGGVPYTVLGTIGARATGNEFVSTSTGMKLALLPAGDFLMGSSAADVKAALAGDNTVMEGYFRDEQPQHRVRITKPFYLWKFEVTQAEYRNVIGRNPSSFSSEGSRKEAVAGFNTDRFPVERVSWFDAVAFCNALSVADGLTPYYGMTGVERDSEAQSIKAATVSLSGGNGYRLPTEAEWEYACRAGTTTPYYFGSVLNGDKANVDGDFPFGTKTNGTDLGRPTTVDDAKYPPNAFGLVQMHGNVLEWCWDGFDEAAYEGRGPLTNDPVIASPTDRRVLRGGAWFLSALNARSALRARNVPENRFDLYGFRVARTP